MAFPSLPSLLFTSKPVINTFGLRSDWTRPEGQSSWSKINSSVNVVRELSRGIGMGKGLGAEQNIACEE